MTAVDYRLDVDAAGDVRLTRESLAHRAVSSTRRNVRDDERALAISHANCFTTRPAGLEDLSRVAAGIERFGVELPRVPEVRT